LACDSGFSVEIGFASAAGSGGVEGVLSTLDNFLWNSPMNVFIIPLDSLGGSVGFCSSSMGICGFDSVDVVVAESVDSDGWLP